MVRLINTPILVLLSSFATVLQAQELPSTLERIGEHKGPVITAEHLDVIASKNKSGFETGHVVKIEATKHLVQLIADNGNKLSTGFLGTAILNQTLSEFGQADMAYNLLLQRYNPSWLYSIDQGATTIWERWNSYTIKDGFGDARMNSFNHYAYGAVVEWMYAYMAGIRSDGAGFRKIIIMPQLDLRTHIPENQQRICEVNASVASINGIIKSH
ncbi:MAG: hypothetical protein ACK5JS_03935 [Mangrovibacterium sp.]